MVELVGRVRDHHLWPSRQMRVVLMTIAVELGLYLGGFVPKSDVAHVILAALPALGYMRTPGPEIKHFDKGHE
ncbi:MAG: hypothetical protein QOG26_762 [Solirubrobacterales bacterium]|nr:hypothetical protein [Solirubrobacterales bacterium]